MTFDKTDNQQSKCYSPPSIVKPGPRHRPAVRVTAQSERITVRDHLGGARQGGANRWRLCRRGEAVIKITVYYTIRVNDNSPSRIIVVTL